MKTAVDLNKERLRHISQLYPSVHTTTSFEEVLRTTREQLARYYLTNTQLGYAEISFLIGFEEPSSFFRAFREWTGDTPESMRMASRH